MDERMVEKICYIVNDNIKDNIIGVEKFSVNLKDFGMDSLAFIKIVVTLEEEFNVEIPDSKLIVSEMDTMEKMYNVIGSIINKD